MRRPVTAVYCALFAVLILLLLAGRAGAAPAPTAQGDLAIAEAFWGRSPAGCSSVTFGTTPLPGRGGEATEPIAGEAPVPCVIEVTEVGVEGTTPWIACMIAAHEWGHLLGEGHSPDPASIMYADGPNRANLYAVPGCVEGSGETAAYVWMTSPFGEAMVAHRQALREWQESRGLCRISRGPFRQRCWREARAQLRRVPPAPSV